MNIVGFDSIMMKREAFRTIVNPLSRSADESEVDNASVGKPRIAFKALLGVSISIDNYEVFAKEYEKGLSEALKSRNLKRQKEIYKAAQLMRLSAENGLDIMGEMLESLNPFIDQINIYSTHLESMPFVSVFGGARGQRIHPLEYMQMIENSYPQICGWKYTTLSNSHDCILQFDHFEGKVSPSWKEMKTKAKMEVYYNGAEVNPLISLVDMTLRLIDTYQRGKISATSMTQPLKEHAWLVAPKARFYEIISIDDLKMITPNVPADMDVNNFIKHPVFFLVWNPKEPRKLVKRSFEVSPLYNLTMRRAAKMGGCAKFLELGKDEQLWSEEDYLVLWDSVDVELVEELGRMHADLPKQLSLKDLRED